MESWTQQIGSLIPFDMLPRLLTAIVAGGVIGWERERRDKPAGLRTHMLVALGAAVFMVATTEFSLLAEQRDPAIRSDPMRALAGIIGGVGFLGAGTIIQARGSVWGITTAASIWVSAAAGACCGMGLYQLAITSSLLALAVLWGIGFLEHSIFRRKEAQPRLFETEPKESG